MGACEFFNRGKGTSAREVFNILVEDSQDRSGHEYSGEIGMKDRFVSKGTAATWDEAEEKAQEYLENYKDGSPSDKWGPAGCIEVEDPSRPKGERWFLFFGSAAS